MGLFDLFSGSKAKEPYYQAAAGRAAGLTQATGTLNQGYGDAQQYLDKIPGYLDNAQGILGGAMQYPENAKGYYDSAKGYLESAKEPLNTASARFDPLAKTSGQGFDAYAQLYGIGGGDPTAAVRAQPGYQFSQNEGAEQIKRNAASMGMLSSGNAMQSVFDRGANIADTKWQQYAEGLKPFLSLAPQIAGQQGGYDVARSGLEAGKAGLEAQKAPLEAGKAGIAGQQAGYEAQKGGYATQSAGLETGLADRLAQYQTGTANANSQGIIDAQNASNAASKNAFDAIMGGAKLAVGAATGMPTGGGGGGFNLSSLFGGGSSAGLGGNPNQSLAGYDPRGNYYNYG